MRKPTHPIVIVDGVEGKVCSHCQEFKPRSKFAKHKDCVGGIRAVCHTCSGRWARKHHKERVNATVRRYQKSHPIEHRLRKRAAQSRRHGRHLGGTITVLELRNLLSQHGGLCVYCGNDAECVDHVIPLSRGGEHKIDNMVPACKSCNGSKASKTPDEWLACEGG